MVVANFSTRSYLTDETSSSATPTPTSRPRGRALSRPSRRMPAIANKTVVRRGLNTGYGQLKHTGVSPEEIEMKKLMLVLVASACCSAFTMNASAQQADQATADAVIAMTKAQWAAEIKDPMSVAEQSKDTSDDYTEFNGDYATRLDGKAMNLR